MSFLRQSLWKESPNGKILSSDVVIAKNYLSETELRNLNNIVNIFLDIAEDNAERNIAISKKEADEKALNEYEKYKVIQDKKYVSDFDKLLLETEKISENESE